jgi:hypothetical protein
MRMIPKGMEALSPAPSFFSTQGYEDVNLAFTQPLKAI